MKLFPRLFHWGSFYERLVMSTALVVDYAALPREMPWQRAA